MTAAQAEVQKGHKVYLKKLCCEAQDEHILHYQQELETLKAP